MGRLRYKGYTGSVEYSEEECTFFGKVLGLRRDGITYEGSSAAEIKQDFEDAIDHYLETCREQGISPEKPYNGKFVLRQVLFFSVSGCVSYRAQIINKVSRNRGNVPKGFPWRAM